MALAKRKTSPPKKNKLREMIDDLIDMRELLGIELFSAARTIPSYSIGNLQGKKSLIHNNFSYILGARKKKLIQIY